jgi:penicillin-binding protein 1C
LLRTIFTSLFLIIFVALCGLSIAFYQYYRIASTLPDIDDLRQNASQFETTRILDRNGDVLYEIIDPNAGRRTYVTLDKISPYLVAATIATEDKGFYSHPGFDPIAIARAFWQNYQGGEIISGASTITQQLARNLLFTPEERIDQSYQRKIREAVLAAEITRRYSKDEILELYLNENFYGNLSYGIEAAAETYFNTTSDKLTLGEASFLAGLPQAPSIYDVYTNPEAAFSRHDDVLVLMYETSQEQGCIYVSNQPQPICLDPAKVTIAAAEIREYPFDTPDIQMRYPHWVNYVRALLEAQYDPQTIYRSGFTVFTTLDPALQDIAQAAVQEQIQSMTGQNAGSGALVIIRPTTGEILTMVGSADFYNEDISGQVNMAVNPRQPGSSIKPLTYLASFEQGLTPASLVWDVPSEFPPSGQPDDPRPPYKPVNYDGRFHGPVTLRYALANSYNIPAVKVLDYVGIYDDPATPQEEGLIPFARRMGITTLNRSDYGLSLTLGGGEVTLLEMTGAYAVFANNGRRIPPVAITRILDSDGNLVYEYQPNPGEQVIRPEHAYLISSILADNQARTPAFGANSVLNLPFPAAAKTGTTNDIRDNWTIGYTPDLAVGVWVGNPDYTPMVNTSGLAGAAPIWSNVMQAGMGHVVGDNPTPFNRPGGVVERVICEVSGTLPSQWCPQQRSEIFAADQPPLPKEEDLWQKVVIDTWTGLRASAACPDFTDEKFVLNVSDSWAKKWIRKDPDGQKWAKGMGFEKPVTFTPSRECRADDPRPRLVFTSPQENMTITTSPLDIYGIVDATHGFDFMRLEYGLGDKPVEWQLLAQSRDRLSNPGLIHSWDVSLFPPERVTLRLTIRGTEDNYAETSTHLTIQVPTPTPTPTPTATFTPTPSPTPEPTLTPTFTSTLPPSPSPTITLPPLPTIAFPTETPTPSLTPTATPTE